VQNTSRTGRFLPEANETRHGEVLPQKPAILVDSYKLESLSQEIGYLPMRISD